MSVDIHLLNVYVQLMEQAQQEFRSTKKEIEDLWADLCELQMTALQHSLEPDEESRFSRVKRQYSRMATKQLRNLETIDLVMKSHQEAVLHLSEFRDGEMRQEIFEVVCNRFVLESTRIFGSSEAALEAIRNFIQKKL